MVLDSQMPRPGGSRRSYMSSRRRRGSRWPWLVLIGVAAAGVGLYNMISGEGQPHVAQADGGADRPADDASTTAERGPASPDAGQTASTRITHINQLAPPTAIEPRQPRPAVPTPVADRPGLTAPPTAPVAPPAPPAFHPGVAGSSSRGDVARGMALIEQGNLVEGRTVLSKALTGHPPLAPADEQRVRDVLTSVNAELVFSPRIVEGDPLVERYQVQSGDLLARIAPRYKVTYQLLEQINQISARNLQAGKAIKLVRGPFFAVVSKSGFRMDIYLMLADGSPIYIRSFPVGLGEGDSTPTGTWVIRKGSKTVNPDWRNPRTGEYFAANDPKNPIGEYWLALEGLDGDAKDKTGYGIHGTIDPDSIGRMMSLGCIRLRDADIEQVFKLLVDGESKVYIVR